MQKPLQKHSLKGGSAVEIETAKGAKFRGVVIPSAEADVVMLKLDTGYNVGIELGKVKSVKKIGAGKKVGKPKVVAVKKNPKLPTVAILHTGGTIASRVDYRTGAVYSAFTPQDLLALFPEISGIGNFDCKLVMNKMSEDMRFGDYGKLAKAVAAEVKKGARGVIIGHGTDTMAYTSAALSFALEGCPVPVLLVGAQRSSDRGSSDAGMNLVCAANFIVKSDFVGVAVCMHDRSGDEVCAILPATKTRKMHTTRRDAFRAINAGAIARVNYKTREIEFLGKDYIKRGRGALKVKDKFAEKVGLLKTRPNMLPEEILFYKKNKYKGLVIEGTGLGHAPISVKGEDGRILKAIEGVVKSGCVVAVTSQCIYGRVNPKVYTNLRKLAGAGAVFCEDMLPETAFVKLAWLLGNCRKRSEVEQLVRENLRGEITPRTGVGTFDVE